MKTDLNKIKERYTTIQECDLGGYGVVAYTVWIKVNQQSFCVTTGAIEQMDEVEYTRDMLAQAILAIIKDNNPWCAACGTWGHTSGECPTIAKNVVNTPSNFSVNQQTKE